MKSRELSPRVRDLIREAARVALNPSQQWLEEFDRATLAAAPPIAENPDLATVISRANRANLRHFAASNLRNPGDPVPANLGAEPLRMARDLVRLGLDTLALDVYRVGQNVAWQRWTDIVFGLTTDPRSCANCSMCRFGRLRRSSTPRLRASPRKWSSSTTSCRAISAPSAAALSSFFSMAHPSAAIPPNPGWVTPGSVAYRRHHLE